MGAAFVTAAAFGFHTVASALETAADAQTMSDYSWSLGNKSSTRYNGRVWTDKSVSTEDVKFTGDAGETVTVPIGEGDDASDFLVTYSALATSQQVSGESNVPVDVVFVIDNSNSMDAYLTRSQTRLEATVSAVNSSIAQIMETSPDSRVAVVVYGSNAETLLPLGHYEPMQNGSYITVTGDYTGNNSSRTEFTASGNHSVEMTGGNRGTNIHMGVDAGMDILKNASNIGEGVNKHVPALILLSDGAATYSGSGDWWDPSDRTGSGSDTNNAHALKVAMNAQYNKQLVNQHYGVTDEDSAYACQVYTIGMGIEQLNSGRDRSDYYRAQMALDPGDHLTDNNNVANAIEEAWDWYINGKTVETGPFWDPNYETTYTPELNNYTFNHPETNDISTIAYNDGYYSAENAEDVASVFDDITTSIITARPQAPTKVEGGDPVESGYITYTDVIGDYMEVDSVKTLLWAGKEFKNPQVSGEGTADVTYTFEGEIQNPAYDNAQNANQIQITVHTDTSADGTKTQTLTVKIPATAIPLRVNTVELSENAQGETTVVNTSNNAYPLRLVYGVSLQDGIDPTTLEGVSDAYIADNTEDGKVNFYSNKYTGQTQGGKTVGDAKVEFTPADNNPFYFLQENTPIYTSQTGDNRVERDDFDENATYWVPVTYYDGNQIVNTRVARAASTMTGYIGYEQVGSSWQTNEYAYIEAGAPRLGNLTDVVRDKRSNTTGTAETSLYPTFEGNDVHNGKFVVYLGNNGKLQLDAPASLIIAKVVTAEEGLTAPDATFTFEVTYEAKAGGTVSATITTGSGQTATTEDTTVQFNADGVATVTLKADQSIELKGMAGADYSIKETNLPSGFNFNKVEGADQTTGSGNDTVASGTVQTGAEDETVTFTNNYSVESVTSEELGIDLGGTKTITGRSFQEDDTFTFTIAAGRLTPDAPLPSATGGEDSVTITPTSGNSATFEFDPITFTEPGEYCYIIRETDPTAGGTTPGAGLGGVDYDTVVYRISVVIVDNGDGTLRLATTDEIAGMETLVENYTSNPMLQVLEGTGMTGAEAIQFDNSYNSESTTATIQGMKVLDVANSDYKLQDGDFTFKIEALGSNTDGGNQFTADETQPKPVDQNGDELTQTTNVANGNVRFDFAEDVFTQDMVGKTFGYKITEANPSPEGSIMSNGVTYDTSEQIVKITVADDGQGNVIAQVTPNTAAEGDPAVNFTFTNSYEPEEVTIGNQANAGITVQKTFTGHEWTDDYSFEYTLKAVSNTTGIDVNKMPMPGETTLSIANPVSGSVNTNAFGEMTFERAGEYVYEITEKNGGHGGVTYDSHTAKVTVVVSENAETGKLSAAIQYDNSTASEADKNVEGAAAFTNTYDAEFDTNTAVNLDGTKNLTVGGNSPRTLGEGQFYAVVTALDGAPLGDAAVAPGATTYNIANTADDSADNGVFTGSFEGLLNNITFKLSDLNGAASRDFVYLISEQQGNATGVTYDQSVYQVTVTVIDDGEGKLSAGEPQIVKGTMQDDQFVADQSQEGVNGVVFDNSYEPTSTTYAPLKITKVLSGDRKTDLQQGEFSFEMSVTSADPQDGITLPQQAVVENAADGSVQFGDITFTKVGTYVVQVKEVVPAEDSDERVPGVTYDEHVIARTFTVRDVDGKLVVNVTGTTGSTTFTNEYTSTGTTDAALSGTKYISGRDFMKGDTFTFGIVGAYDGNAENVTAPLPENVRASEDNAAQGTIAIAPESGSSQAIDFGKITFTKPGTYTYTVSEQGIASSVKNVTKDSTVYTVTYTVTDDGDGTMTVSEPVYAIQGAEEGTEAPTALTWTNTYKPDSVALDGEDQLSVTKEVTGAPALSDFEFTLTLTSDNADGVEGLGENNSITKSTSELTGKEGDEAKQTVSFGNLTFTEAGVYTFKVVENTTATADGWTYASGEDNAKTITVKVTDDFVSGQLEATTELGGTDTNNPTFTNSYKAGSTTTGDGDLAKLTVTKTVTGAPATEEFDFELTPDEDYGDAVKGLNDEGKLTVSTNDLKGKEDSRTLTFDDLTFNEEGIYTFNVKETNADPAEGSGWTYDNDAAQKIVVKVTDENHDGKLDATTLVDGKDTNNPTFKNVYVPAEITTDAETGTAIQVTKKVIGHDAIEDFDFTLKLKDGQNSDAVFEGAGDEKTKFDGMEATSANDIKAGATETMTFGDITFTEEGDYVFVIDETTTTTAGGWTYDADTEEVTVHVKDDGEGALYIDDITNNNPTFENKYVLKPVTFRAARFKLEGNKVLDGRDWEADDEFTFTLTAGVANVDGQVLQPNDPIVQATLPKKTSDTIKPFEDDSKVTDNTAQFTFTSDRIPSGSTVEEDTFTYTKPGTYRYLIRETNPNASVAGSGILGVSYDQTVYRLTVIVTDNHDGTMSATSAYSVQNEDGSWSDLDDSSQITFTNKYSADQVDITFNAFKVLEDRNQPMKDNEFKFHMEFAGWAANDANADPEIDSDWTMDDTTKAPNAAPDKGNIIRGDVTFGDVTFTSDNVGYTYRYKITENKGNVPGVTYDESAKYVTAKVTSVQQANDDGTFTEHVRVETSGEAEWNNETNTAPTTGAIFTNTYKAGATTDVPAGFTLTKQFTGHKWTDDYSFEFMLTAEDSQLADGTEVVAADVPMPDSATKTVNGPDDGDVTTAVFDFGSISYKEPGTYNYTVTEKNAGQTIDGVTYDKTPATVTVTVVEGKDDAGDLTGQLVATAVVSEGTFENTYHTEADYSGNIGLDITKQVTNHAMADGQFSFTIEATGDNADAAAKKLGIQDGTTATVESAQAAAGAATSVKNNPFETVKFDKSDDGVTYTYAIKENGATGEGEYKNYVLDDTTYEVKITATDNGDGTMSVKTVVNGTEYVDQRATAAFENSYKADPTTVGAKGAATIEGTKTLKNDTLAANQFTFQVKSSDVVVSTGTNAANGTITFDDITYTTANLAAATTAEGSSEVGKVAGTPQVTDEGTVYTFNYVVSEITPDQNSGVTASSSAQNITITVTDDGNGKLTPKVTYGDGDPLAFENVYGGDAEYLLDIAGTKEIVGAQDNLNVPALTADAYEFTIVGHAAADGTPAPMPDVPTVGNDASGNVTFEDITYTMENTFGNKPATTDADTEAAAEEAATDEVTTDEGIETYTADRTQEFTYTISESGSVDGVTNEQGIKTVTVKVTDLGGGKLKAEVTSAKTESGADFKFTNVYDVTPETSSLTVDGGFTITKDFSSTNTDRPLGAEEFEFVLKSGNDVVATATNDADGNVSFGGIEFTKPGNYNYVLSEVENGVPGVDYDTASYNVTAKVEDQGDGSLEVTWEMPQAVDDGVSFKNTYTAASTSITFNAAKVLEGRELAEGEFTFELRENGAVIDTATNAADGTVSFNEIVYNEPGEHDYEIVEVEGNAEGVTYDTTVHTVHVSVTDDTTKGALVTAWSYGDTGAPVFTNTYEEPVEPVTPVEPTEPEKPEIPQTSDTANPIIPAALAAGGAALVAGAAIWMRRRSR